MRRIGRAAKQLLFNWKPLVGFEFIYKAGTILFCAPLLLLLLDLVMEWTGYAYLTAENVLDFLAEPLTFVAIMLSLLVAATVAVLDISAVVFTVDQSMQGRRVTISQILRFALQNTRRIWQPKNVLLVPVVLLLLPFVNLSFASGILVTVSVPEAISDFLLGHRAVAWIIGAAMVLITVLSLRWIYTFYYFTLENCGFSAARRKSAALGKGRRLRDFAVLFLIQAASFAGYMLLLLLAVGAAGMLGKLLSQYFRVRWIVSSAIWSAAVFALAVVAALAAAVGYGCVGIRFYKHKSERGEPVVSTEPPIVGESRHPGRVLALKIGAAGIAAAGGLTVLFLLFTGRINPEIEYLHTMEITAHRGASAFYPENTMAAFEGARDLGADWIELDVQQSKDGQIIVLHDANLKRTTGVNAYAYALTYNEIAQLDAGRWFGKDFAGERIPLLSQVLDFAKECGIRLNIEIKPTGHETMLAERVVDEIRAAGYADDCVITSQVYGILERVKAYDPSITTGYVMRLAYGNLNGLAAADHFSVEASNVTESLVTRVHNAGKKLYAWTVDSRRSIDRMIDLNVDNLITNNIELAKNCVYENRYSVLLDDYAELFE